MLGEGKREHIAKNRIVASKRELPKVGNVASKKTEEVILHRAYKQFIILF